MFCVHRKTFLHKEGPWTIVGFKRANSGGVRYLLLVPHEEKLLGQRKRMAFLSKTPMSLTKGWAVNGGKVRTQGLSGIRIC